MRFVALLAFTGCTRFPDEGDDARGLLGTGLLDPFPSVHLLDADGFVALPSSAMPDADTEAPVERVAWRRGFSPVQTAIVALPDVEASGLPSWRDPVAGEGSVLLVDLDDGVFLPVMAELDAHPDAADAPTLIIRPQAAMPYGHQVAVVVTTAAAARPARFDALLHGRPPEDFAHRARHYRDLVDRIEEIGVNADDVALAWDFPVADGTAPLRSALSQSPVPTEWAFTRVKNDGDDDAPGGGAWRSAEGDLTVPRFLVDDTLLDLAADGTVTATGTTTAPIYVHVPQSVKDAPAGSVPVLVYGHGIFGSEGDALDLDPGYVSAPTWLAEEQGFIVVSTRWRGLDYEDRGGAAAAAGDWWTMPSISDRMVQGQVQARALVDAVALGDLLDDPVFQGASGQPLGDPSAVYFWGNSMGAILGLVMMAQDPPIHASVHHTFGSTWSTLLERSGAWMVFEGRLVDEIPDPWDRQVLYASSQLWWDAVDPAAYATELSTAPILLQENTGDDSVSNLGSRVLARSVGLEQLEPMVEPVLGGVAGPLPGGSRAYVQYNPGTREPPDENRPAPVTGAHNATSYWAGTRGQMRDFLDPASPGRVVHHCGDEPCSRTNRGSVE